MTATVLPHRFWQPQQGLPEPNPVPAFHSTIRLSFRSKPANRLFERLGHSMTVPLYPWVRALEMAKSGAADCIFTIFWTPERAEFLDFGMESMIEQEIFFYMRADSTISFNGNLDTMRYLCIGTRFERQLDR